MSDPRLKDPGHGDATTQRLGGKRLGGGLEEDAGVKRLRLTRALTRAPVETASVSGITQSGLNLVEDCESAASHENVDVRNTGSVESGPEDDLKVEVITNDGDPDHMMMLIGLKEIFHRQLPKMPKEYIVRLVFDRKHQSLVLSRGGVPIGGISYRPFYEQNFVEIVFCAVTTTEQIKGYGSRLMNELKEHTKLQGISYFQTYADNFAIGYFAKQGFSRTISMSKDRWVGYVKDYDGGTHMECYIHPTIPYLEQAEMLRKQRAFIVECILEHIKCPTVYPGLACFKKGKTADPLQIPGVLDAGWTVDEVSKQTQISCGRDRAKLHKELTAIWRQVEKNENAWPFREPVDVDTVTDYLEIIPTPIDLKTMKGRLEMLDPPFYKSKAMLKADMLLMLSNCQTYNAKNTVYFKHAVALTTVVEDVFAASSSTTST